MSNRNIAAVIEEILELFGPAAAAGIDMNALEAYASQVATLREAQHRVESEGQIIMDPKGNPIGHPCIGIAKAAQAEIRAWGTQFRPKKTRIVVRPGVKVLPDKD